MILPETRDEIEVGQENGGTAADAKIGSPQKACFCKVRR